jgi:hypothetical protein
MIAQQSSPATCIASFPCRHERAPDRRTSRYPCEPARPRRANLAARVHHTAGRRGGGLAARGARAAAGDAGDWVPVAALLASKGLGLLHELALSCRASPPRAWALSRGGIARCNKGGNSPYHLGLSQQGRVTLIRHDDDFKLFAPCQHLIQGGPGQHI